jgi:hypothetical protein
VQVFTAAKIPALAGIVTVIEIESKGSIAPDVGMCRSNTPGYDGTWPFVELCSSWAAEHPKPLTNSEKRTGDAEKSNKYDVELARTWPSNAARLKTEKQTDGEVLRNNRAAATNRPVN